MESCLCSYSYDVSRTLQYNLLPCKLSNDLCPNEAKASEAEFWQTEGVQDEFIHDSIHSEADIEDASCAIQNPLESEEGGVRSEPKLPSSSSSSNLANGVGAKNGCKVTNGHIPVAEPDVSDSKIAGW